MNRAPALAACIALLGCASEIELAVDLRTDLVAGVEFDAVRVGVDGADETPIQVDAEDGSPSLRVFEGRVARGRHELEVTLLLMNAEVVARAITVVIERDSIIAAVVTRNCRDVVCPSPSGPSDATECLAGLCVRPECLESGGVGCDPPECVNDGDCSAVADCATPRCTSGTCLAVPDPGACDAASYCDPDRGCVPIIASDAGVPADAPGDAGAPDAGAPDVGVSCAPLTTCGGSCVDLTDVMSCGTTCGNATDCSALAGVATATCSSSGCVIGGCTTGYRDCDGVVATGCEVSLDAPTSCGTTCAARVDCTTRPNVMNATCSSGTCVIGACNPGFLNCDANPTNGCETNVWMDTACGLGCSGRINCTDRPHTTSGTCVSGTCNITCSPLYGNCNGIAGDGCECSTG